jgi:hypothetical protein
MEKLEKAKQEKRMIEQRKLEIEKENKMKLENAENLIISGRYEEAAKIFDEFKMWEKAGECRRMAKTSYQISTNFNLGKDGTISCRCPICSSSQIIESKSNIVKCGHCGNNYILPKKILDMI